jgi:plasmid stabilization system protein ParE
MLGRLRLDIMSIKGGLRAVAAHPYTIFYRLGDTGGVEIVRVLHEHRDLPAALAP